MLALLLLGLLAAAGAAPHRPRHHPPPFDDACGGCDIADFFNDDLFDTNRFWEGLRREMLDLDAALAALGRHFPGVSSSVAVQGNEVKVTIPLEGFEEKDIKVKAGSGVLMVQAVHGGGGNQRGYMHSVTLPAGTDPTGSWTFVGGVLTVTFPYGPRGASTPVPITTAAPPRSREEMEESEEVTKDADVGLGRGDQADPQLETNEIPTDRVEATTYAVDVKGDVDFVPVQYQRSGGLETLD